LAAISAVYTIAPAFTQFGIKCLQEIVRDLRAASKALPQPKSTE
jgi:hypothetical protein